MNRWKSWGELPEFMKNEYTLRYYRRLSRKRGSMALKRIFDVIMSLILLVPLSPVILVLAIWIKADSKGPVFFRQERITQYGRKFKIYKFRTMVDDANKKGSLVTTEGDARITRVGAAIRKYRLDEIPQLFNVLAGDMTFVGTRPEVEKYVMAYTPSMMATLLMPAGITSDASIKYKDEEKLLKAADDVDHVYIKKVLPKKMRYNLSYLKHFSIIRDIRICIETVLAVLK